MSQDALEIRFTNRVKNTLTAPLLDNPQCDFRGVRDRRRQLTQARNIRKVLTR